mmetsp:Transcript_108484/g.302532  ORF Transcript_108484/g.302532 Transcript_108484/m.302532 type:complete len:299 (-) Transcript_108484:116-1012(-)
MPGAEVPTLLPPIRLDTRHPRGHARGSPAPCRRLPRVPLQHALPPNGRSGAGTTPSGGEAAAPGPQHVAGDLRGTQAKDVGATEVLEALLEAFHGGLLSRPHAHAGVVELLVGLGLAFRVADLRLEIGLVLCLEVANAAPIGPLRVRVDVHLDHTILQGLADVLEVGARATVEDKLHRLLLSTVKLLRNVLLRVAEDLRLQAHIARLVDSMDVAKGRSDCKDAVGHLGQGLVDLPDLLRLGVEVLGVRVLVVHAVLLAPGDAELHLEATVDLRHALQVLGADLNVLLQRLLGQVNHVR